MTIVETACKNVEGFHAFYQKFVRRMTISDRAESTCINYGRSLASAALYFNCLPTQLNIGQVEEYLFLLKGKYGEDSDNCFKFMICALRFAYKMEGMEVLRMQLPPLRKRKKLPVVLSKQEMTAMLNIPCLMRHRVLIAVLYGCGLRCAEVRNIKISDIDFDRAQLHVRQGKGRKDRYVPMGKNLTAILERYVQLHKPVSWLFPGKRWGSKGNVFISVFEPQYGQRSVQWAIKRAGQLAGITKPLSVHSLRHTYATHLLEDGVNILTIQQMLGHAHVRTTMLYLHVAQINNHQKCSPLDTLEGLKVIGTVQGMLDFD
ncbi:MAG: tyrosine-type recombinase/integrase [Ferruginibacter sp.]